MLTTGIGIQGSGQAFASDLIIDTSNKAVLCIAFIAIEYSQTGD